MKKSRISLPIAIVLASIIVSGFFYAVQVNKQRSIEKQVLWQLEQDQKEFEAEEASQRIEDLKKGAEDARRQEEVEFENNLKCQDLLIDLKKRWNNVTGIYYSKWQNTCIVKYRDTDTGEDEEAPIEDMADS